jgi:hypothetical protein
MLDGNRQSHSALRLLRREHPKWKYVLVRTSQYLNNLIEQDHRAIKRRCASMGGFKTFGSAAITLAGIELAHRNRKRQFSLGRGRYRNFGSLKQLWARALAVRCQENSGFFLFLRPQTQHNLSRDRARDPSPAQQTWPNKRTEKGAQRDRAARPEGNKGGRRTGLVDYNRRRPQSAGHQACDRASQHKVCGRRFAQTSN